MLHEIFYFGPLRVILDAVSGKVLAVQDRISGEAAAFRYSAEYIRTAEAKAQLAFASLIED